MKKWQWLIIILFTCILILFLVRYISKRDIADENINQLLTLPEDFSIDWAIKNDYLVKYHDTISNIHLLDEFINNINVGIESNLRIISLTGEGDIIIDLLIYNGEYIENYMDTTRDNFGPQGITRFKAHNIEVYEEDIKEHFIGEHILREYYMIGENEKKLLIRIRVQ
jgi:hypothetical protein